MTGGPSAAANGDLVCMVGGDPAVIERARPVFDAIWPPDGDHGALRHRAGRQAGPQPDHYGSWLAAYEGQRLAEAAGISLADLAEVIRASDARIGGASTLMFRTTAAPFTDADDKGLVGAMAAAAQLAHKDLAAALELAAVAPTSNCRWR